MSYLIMLCVCVLRKFGALLVVCSMKHIRTAKIDGIFVFKCWLNVLFYWMYALTSLCVWLFKLKSFTQLSFDAFSFCGCCLWVLVHGTSFGYTQLCIDVKLVSLNSLAISTTIYVRAFIHSFRCISFRFISNKFFLFISKSIVCCLACQSPCVNLFS